MNLIHTIFEPGGEGPHPTILAIHGWGASASDLLALAPHICNGRFMVISPQGPIDTPVGPGAVGYGWFPISMDGPPDVPAILSARAQLRVFLDASLARYPIDRDKLIALGFSQGGAMAYSLALDEPERFAALVSISSRLSSDLLSNLPYAASARCLPTLVQHGSRDQLIKVDCARETVETLRNLRIPVTYREYDIGHEISPRSLADLSSWLEEKVLSPIVLAG
ncbi:MAG: alpha/beta hydrolase [Candidatus Binatia bacterium]